MAFLGRKRKKQNEEEKIINIKMEIALISREIAFQRRDMIMRKVEGYEYDPEKLDILNKDRYVAEDLSAKVDITDTAE